MLGAIAGDIIGSVYEFNNIKSKDFPLFRKDSDFTDDTVLTIAIADAILNNKPYDLTLKEYYRRYPNRGYGEHFHDWGMSDTLESYNSWGNGSAMRVSTLGYAFEDLETVLKEAKKTAEVTHSHPEGIKGAQATAAAIFLSLKGKNKTEIKEFIETKFDYNLSQKIAEIRPYYNFNVSCQGSVPQAIIAFLESENYEDSIRNAISLGGDSDTIACICGGIAEAFYGGISEYIKTEIEQRLTPHLRDIVTQFRAKYVL